jgi:hypothetical protein
VVHDLAKMISGDRLAEAFTGWSFAAIEGEARRAGCAFLLLIGFSDFMAFSCKGLVPKFEL